MEGRSGWLRQQQGVVLSSQTLMYDNFLDLKAALSPAEFVYILESKYDIFCFPYFFDWELMRAVGCTLIIYTSPSTEGGGIYLIYKVLFKTLKRRH